MENKETQENNYREKKSGINSVAILVAIIGIVGTFIFFVEKENNDFEDNLQEIGKGIEESGRKNEPLQGEVRKVDISGDEFYYGEDFSFHQSTFQFSADILSSWNVEYHSDEGLIAILDKDSGGGINDALIIMGRTSQEDFSEIKDSSVKKGEVGVGRRDGVIYDILPAKDNGTGESGEEKKEKDEQQKFWTGESREAVLVEYNDTENSDVFYLIKSPSFSQEDFLAFLDSFVFYNDEESFNPPLIDAEKRITKKPFGKEVSPGNSPVKPEIFSGFHTGTDFEIMEGEEDENILVFSVCGGEIVEARKASGYGGVVVQKCFLNDEVITVIYGHLSLEDISKLEEGMYFSPGKSLGMLGEGESEDTDGERKHLHLGIKRGEKVDISGYVQDEKDLEDWLDFEKIISFLR